MKEVKKKYNVGLSENYTSVQNLRANKRGGVGVGKDSKSRSQSFVMDLLGLQTWQCMVYDIWQSSNRFIQKEWTNLAIWQS